MPRLRSQALLQVAPANAIAKNLQKSLTTQTLGQ
jgi:hypothetical protein